MASTQYLGRPLRIFITDEYGNSWELQNATIEVSYAVGELIGEPARLTIDGYVSDDFRLAGYNTQQYQYFSTTSATDIEYYVDGRPLRSDNRYIRTEDLGSYNWQQFGGRYATHRLTDQDIEEITNGGRPEQMICGQCGRRVALGTAECPHCHGDLRDE